MDPKALEQIQEVTVLLRAVQAETTKDFYETVVPEAHLGAALEKLNRLIDAELRDSDMEDVPF